MFLAFYRLIWLVILPFYVVFYLYRAATNKEDIRRVLERFGVASERRLQGELVWFHAASVGESLAILPLLEKMNTQLPSVQVLLTTGTKTSAKLMANRLPSNAIHQYLPWDFYPFVRLFMKTWQPNVSIFVESEFWPEALSNAPHPLLINARVSDRSFPKYVKYKKCVTPLLQHFEAVLAQDEITAERLQTLGVKGVINSGNLKMDAPVALPNGSDLAALKETIGARPVWVVSSTHAPEEEMLLPVFETLKKTIPTLLMIVIPRHPHRGGAVARLYEDAGYQVSRRGTGHTMMRAEDDVYVADTIGEVVLWYSLAHIVFMGGSLVPHGGQNPYEPLKYGKVTLCGEHMFNFKSMMKEFKTRQVILQVNSTEQLTQDLQDIFASPEEREMAERHISAQMQGLGGATSITFEHIKEHLKGWQHGKV